jgi:hypothetical protein
MKSKTVSGMAMRTEIMNDSGPSDELSRAENLTYELLYQSSGHFREFVDQRRIYGYSKRLIWDTYSEMMDGNEDYCQARF